MSDTQVISIIFGSASGIGNTSTMASNTTIHRIGFFFTFNDAQAGTNDIATEKLGFSNTDWTTGTSLRTVSATGSCKIGSLNYTRVVSNDDFNYSRSATGPYIRIFMTTVYDTAISTTTSGADDIRIWLRLKIIGNNYKWYSLAFSYAGQSRNSVTYKIFDANKNYIVYNGIYRLIEVQQQPTLSPPTLPISNLWGSLQTYLGQADSTITDIRNQTSTANGTLSLAVLNKFYNNTLNSLKVFGGNSYTNPSTLSPSINVGKYIPAWNTSNDYVPCFELGKVSGTPTAGSAQPYYAQFGYQSAAPSNQENYLSRVLMDYGSGNKKCVNKLLIFSPTPGYNTEWSKFEIVASTNGIDFIRLPTKWYTASGIETILETTFSLYWKRARAGNSGNTAYSIVPALDGARAQDVVANQTPFPAASYFPWSTVTNTATANAPLFMWNIDIDNTDEYRYYGFGNVGSDIYFSGNTTTLNTAHTRSPCGYSGFAAVGSIYTWASAGTTASSGWSTGSTPTLNTTNITNISNVDKIRIFLPQVSSEPIVSAPTYYKYWRIRPTTSFLATIGTTFYLYFWKLGLYRTVDEANADTYGFSSNNYLQQYGNTMYINDTSVSQATATAMFVHTGVWTDSTVAVINATAYNNLRLPISSTSSNIYFKLDVYGEIKAIRFPDYMNFDANVRGGTFILERGNALSITSITSSIISSVPRATATTATPHSYNVGDYVTITGATPTGYNLSIAINDTPSNITFTYTIAGELAAASGTITSILWEPMVVTKNNSAEILARNGIMSESSSIVGAAAVQLSSSVYTIETVSEARTRRGGLGTYAVPTTAGTPNVQSGPLAYNTSKTVTIVLSGGNNISYNTTQDFSIHFSTSFTPLDLSSSLLTKFNCTVTGYNDQTQTITFNTIPDFTGDGYFHIFIRNGIGTGITTNTASIVSSVINVTPYAYILDDRVITSSGSWTGMGGNFGGHISWPITITPGNPSNYREYKPDIAGEYALVPSSGSEIIITNLTLSTTTATATTASAHSYLTGDYVCIRGASQTGYNFSSVVITRVDNTSFTYTVASGLVSPATTTTTITSKKWQPITNKMFRGTASLFNGITNTQIIGIKYLMIIENESCVFQSAAISNSVKWKATLSGKTVEVTTSKGTFSNSISDSQTGKYKTNFTFNNSTTASDWFSNVYVNGCPVTADNTTLTSIGPLTSAKGIRFTTTTAGSVDAALGGLCCTDYVMHIEFKVPVTIQIDGFNAYVNDTGTYLGRGTSGTHTFANYPRFGAFNAYTNGFVTDEGTITNITSFIAATTSICTGLGIPMLETNTNLAPVLSKAYGMPIDVNSSFNYYNGLTSTDGTAITFSQGYPSALFTRTKTYTNTSLEPIDLYSSNWPWAGYASNNGSSSNQRPSGYFVDPTSGLSAIGNNGSLPVTIIKVSPTRKKYLYINSVSNGWVIGGIKGGSSPVTPFGASPSFRGTILDTSLSTSLMTSSIQSINYTAISWVGCAFNNKTCLAPVTNAKQSFVWSGFYCGGSVAAASGLLSTYHATTGGKIVWDIGLANGDPISATSYSSPTYITNRTGPHNVLTWTPLVGTNPDDRNTLHVFTLLINDNVSIESDGTNIDNWVQLYQNGKKLTRANIIDAANLRTTYSGGVSLKFMYNSLFTQVSNSSDLSNLFNGASTAGGTPAVNAYAVSTGTQWSFAENDVRNKASLYSESDVFTIMSELGTKWGIVPPIYHDWNSNGAANVIIISTTDTSGRWGDNGVFNISRIGFFSNLENAIGGSNSLDLARDGTNNRLGFDSSIGWDQISNSNPIDINQRGTWWVSTSGSDTLGITTTWTSTLDTTGIPCGQFVRLSMQFKTDNASSMTANAAKVRIRLILRHNSVPFLYGLEFSYNNNVYNTADNAFLSYDGSTNIATILAYKSIFRLIRSKHSTWAAHDASSDKWEWSNPYTIEMDSLSPAVTLGVAKTFATGPNSTSLTNFTTDFKNKYLPSQSSCNMKRIYYSNCGVAIPAWNWTPSGPTVTPYTDIYTSIDVFTVDSINCPLGNDGGHISDSLVRYMWEFTTAVCVNKLMFYSGTPGWQSEWIKFEIVASTDGVNFVRLPTEWSVSNANTVEDTFHIKYNRKSKGNYPTFVFADTLTSIPYGSSNTNITSGKFLLNKSNTRPIAWYVSFINDKKYSYYGFGNVGTDTPYVDLVNQSSNVTDRTYSLRPFSSSIAGTLHQTTSLSNTIGYAVTNNTNLMANSGGVNNLQWLATATAQGYATAIIPIVSSGGANPNAKYRYWRIRATSGFLGATGTAKVYLWKLGLYINSNNANEDTTGLSSNNYFRQYGNALTTHTSNADSSGTSINAGTVQHKAICSNLGSWIQEYTDAISFGGIGGKVALGTNANIISFNSEDFYFRIFLNVAPDIETGTISTDGTSGIVPVIKFPSFMRFDTSMGGGV